MGQVQHTQIRNRLVELVNPHLDFTDLASKSGDDLERNKLSRSISAAAIKIAADTDDSTAARSVVDGGSDNGLDAIHFDAQTKTLYLVQAKWSDSHTSSVDSAGILKFIQGVKDLVSLKKDSFNSKIKKRWSVIEDALGKAQQIRMLVAYSGSGRIDPSIQARLDELVASQNDTSDMFSWGALSQKELFQYFAREAAPPQIDLDINITHYGMIDSPLKAIYGQVSAHEISKWYISHGNRLFAGNIRHFLGLRSDVNDVMMKALSETPDLFWFYNNGITIIAEDIVRKPIGSADRSIGVFACKNVTVVNGAQTVGTIGRSGSSEESTAVVQVRVIKVADADSTLGRSITRASNTQNRIDARNFVALDPEQERIRTELLLNKVNYEFREGEPLESLVDGFDFIEAITVLACSSDEISYVAMAKGYVGGLYANIETTPYKALFNGSTSSGRMWSLVKLARRIDKELKAAYDQTSNIERGIVVHGNRFTLHCVISRLTSTGKIESSDAISDKTVRSVAKGALKDIREIIEVEYPEAYLARLFKNVGKCTHIRELLDEKSPPAPSPKKLTLKGKIKLRKA